MTLLLAAIRQARGQALDALLSPRMTSDGLREHSIDAMTSGVAAKPVVAAIRHNTDTENLRTPKPLRARDLNLPREAQNTSGHGHSLTPNGQMFFPIAAVQN